MLEFDRNLIVGSAHPNNLYLDFMDYNLLTDILLGLGIVLAIWLLHEITSYMTFNWYWMVVLGILLTPVAGIWKIVNLIKNEPSTRKESNDYSSDAINIEKQILTSIWYIFAPLLFWITLIAIDLGVASLSVFIKYQLFGSISMNEVYRICEIVPICLVLIPCVLPPIRERLPKYTKSYIYEDFSKILGVGSNIFVLVIGGWISYKLINAPIMSF